MIIGFALRAACLRPSSCIIIIHVGAHCNWDCGYKLTDCCNKKHEAGRRRRGGKRGKMWPPNQPMVAIIRVFADVILIYRWWIQTDGLLQLLVVNDEKISWLYNVVGIPDGVRLIMMEMDFCVGRMKQLSCTIRLPPAPPPLPPPLVGSDDICRERERERERDPHSPGINKWEIILLESTRSPW